MYLDPPFFQLPGDEVCRAVFFEPQFRVSMDVVADSGKFLLVTAGTVEHGCGHDGHLRIERGEKSLPWPQIRIISTGISISSVGLAV